MDATPLTVGQEFRGYAEQIGKGVHAVTKALEDVYELALGGSAVGTGLNTHPDYANAVAEEIASLTGIHFVTARNKFEALAAHDACAEAAVVGFPHAVKGEGIFCYVILAQGVEVALGLDDLLDLRLPLLHPSRLQRRGNVDVVAGLAKHEIADTAPDEASVVALGNALNQMCRRRVRNSLGRASWCHR